MTFKVRFTPHAEVDLVRLYEFDLERDPSDLALAERALDAIRNATRGLELSPFSYRKATPDNSFLREIVIPFGSSGYVALFEIDNNQTVTILSVRHQREEDFH